MKLKERINETIKIISAKKNIGSKMDKISKLFLEAENKSLIDFKEAVKKKGREWDGEVLVTHSYNEQDGLGWIDLEKVTVNEKEIEISIEYSKFTEMLSELENIKIIFSKDEILEKIIYELSQTFDFEEKKIILLKAEIIFSNGVIINVETEQELSAENIIIVYHKKLS